MKKSRVMMIGLDAASIDFIEASRASLPNLRRALDSGVCRRLRSRTSEILPAAAWPSLYTGTAPGVHGFYYPMQWDPDAMHLRHVRDWLYCEPFWYEFERQGHRVVALDVPVTWPSRLNEATEITDWGAHDHLSAFAVQPSRLRSEIRRRFGTYRVGPEIPVQKSYEQLSRMRDAIVAAAKRKGALAAWLAAREPWDFFIAVFAETHRGGHLFWPDAKSEGRAHPAGALLEVYQAVDRAIGELVAAADLDNTTLIFFAAHGMGGNTSQEHFTREIMDRVNERFETAGESRAGNPRTARQRSLMRRLRKSLPAPIQHFVGRAVPPRVKDFVVDRAITAGHDWSMTPGIAILASVTGYVRFNVRGREREGILERGSATYDRYVRWMDDCFRSFRVAGSGEPLVKDIVFTAEAFPGPRQHQLPDAVICWNGNPPVSCIHSDLLGTIEARCATGRAGNHHPDGFSLVIEPGQRQAARARPGDVLDLKPLVFKHLGAQG